jgi:lipoprotein-anchoring transpeptidase ErfK/SrfK
MTKQAGKADEKLIIVNLASQDVTALIGQKVFHKCDCVTGDQNHQTQRGEYIIREKHERYTSRKYGVPMNYAMFFYNGVALHQYHGPFPWHVLRVIRLLSDLAGSHGCVRLQESDARKLSFWAEKLKTKVRVI